MVAEPAATIPPVGFAKARDEKINENARTAKYLMHFPKDPSCLSGIITIFTLLRNTLIIQAIFFSSPFKSSPCFGFLWLYWSQEAQN
jgi:hypothetical protein